MGADGFMRPKSASPMRATTDGVINTRNGADSEDAISDDLNAGGIKPNSTSRSQNAPRDVTVSVDASGVVGEGGDVRMHSGSVSGVLPPARALDFANMGSTNRCVDESYTQPC